VAGDSVMLRVGRSVSVSPTHMRTNSSASTSPHPRYGSPAASELQESKYSK
jgi:hypothetical protein